MKKVFQFLPGILFLFTAGISAKASSPVSPPDTACDVITLTNGQLIYCKVKYIGDNIIKYTGCGSHTGDSIRVISSSSAKMVNYPNGEYTLVNKHMPDTTPKQKWKPIFHVGINGGISSPILYYGSTHYELPGQLDAMYCGFAGPGYTYNSSLGVVLKKGWELTFMGIYIHNSFNATGFLNENLHNINSNTGYATQLVEVPIAIGTYSYNHYAIFCGATRDINVSYLFSFGFRILAGQYFSSIPEINGIGYPDQSKTGTPASIHIPGVKSGRNFGMDFGMRIGLNVFPWISIFLSGDCVFGSKPTDSLYNTNITVFNSTLGIQFNIKTSASTKKTEL